jgi:FtsZ-binding cell division protein ZapB
MSKTDELEAKIRKAVDVLNALRRENQQLKIECDSLKSHVSMLTSENHKAQRVLADYEQLRKKHDQVTHKVEHALSSLSALRN